MGETSDRRVVLVGNGPTAASQKMGSLIDSFQLICRFNNFVTSGYEEELGNRTDCWAVCDGNIKERDQSVFQKVLFSVPLVRYDDESTWAWKPSVAFTKIPRELIESVTKDVGSRDGVWPSTGMFVIGFFISIYSVVHIHGFDFFSRKRHHYFRHKDKNMHHDRLAETAFVRRLIEEGKVKLLTKA